MKKIFSVLVAVSLVFTTFSVSSLAWFSPITTQDAKEAFKYYISMEYATDVMATILNGGTVDAGVYAGDNSIGVGNSGRNGSASRNYYTENNGINFNSGSTVNVPILDFSKRSLNYINASTNNRYVTNNFTNIHYNQTYNTFHTTINNNNYYIQYAPTYVTVVNGTSVEDAKISRFYFKLPDGRNSSDLTADDVYGMVFGYDAINYNQVLEEPTLTLLTHFDGSHDDVGPNSISHKYQSGASISFSDEGRFDQCLYWPSSEYRYLSYNFAANSGDFTFECFVKIKNPYSANSMPGAGGNTFLSIGVGGLRRVRFSNYFSSPQYPEWGSSLYAGVETEWNDTYSNVNIAGGRSVSSGVYYHVAIVRSGSTVKYYLNGILIYSYTDSSSVERIYFAGDYNYSSLSGHVRTHSSDIYIDEMRFLGRALYSSGFTPPSSPFDSSLVFVLPDKVVDNKIAVKTNIPAAGLRIGGARPTLPPVGFVYLYLKDGIVKDTQVYDGTQWSPVDSVISEADKWVTTKDYKLAPVAIETGTNPDSGSNTGGESGGDSGGTGLSDIGAILKFITEVCNLIIAPINTVFSVLTTLLTTFTTFAASFSSFLGACFVFIPPEMLQVITAGIGLAIAAAFIKFLRG